MVKTARANKKYVLARWSSPQTPELLPIIFSSRLSSAAGATCHGALTAAAEGSLKTRCAFL